MMLRMLALVAVLGLGMRTEAAEPERTDVFVGGVDGYHTYRIPSLICTPKGTLLAFCEGRRFWEEDQTPTDMMLKRSLDGGKTWLPMQTVVKAVPEAAMCPTPVIDRTTGEILLVYVIYPELVKEHWPADYKRAPGLGRDSITHWVTTSSDDGATWSEPVNITAMTKKPTWTRTGCGPGVGIQTRSGRLVIPMMENEPNPDNKNPALAWVGMWFNYAIFSDDHGKTWRMSDKWVGPGVDESQMVELADGALLLNMRGGGGGCRFGAISKNNGRLWSKMFKIPELIDPTCQASILRYTWPDQQGGKSRILFSNPATTGAKGFQEDRRAGTIRISYDEGKTWPVAKLLQEGYFAYSCLTSMPDGTIGCLFESAAGYRKITFARFSLEWLTDGKDSWKR